MRYQGLVLVIGLFLLTTERISAQWIQTNGPNGGRISAFAINGNNIYAGTFSAGIFLSSDNGTNWTSISHDPLDAGITSLTINGNNIFAGTAGGVYLTTNNGANWSWLNMSLTYPGIKTITSVGDKILAGTDQNGVYSSTNRGANWAKLPGLNYSITSLTLSGDTIYAGTYPFGIYQSSNAGQNWTNIGGGIYNSMALSAIVINGNNIFASTDNGIFRSTNEGASWSKMNLGNIPLGSYTIIMSRNIIFAGVLGQTSTGGVYRSTDNGVSWVKVNSGLTDISVKSFACYGNYLFVGTSTGVFLSSDNGENWKPVKEGLTGNAFTNTLSVVGNSLYLGTSCFGVWKRPLSEMITDVKESHEPNQPTHFSLEQNYPNPFNPFTIIKYSIANEGNVKLTVYNAIGSKVATIVDENKPAGNYSVQFNGGNLASGIYLYRLESGNYSAAKKLILIK